MHAKTKIEGRRRRRKAIRRRIRNVLLILALIAVCVLLTGLSRKEDRHIIGYEYKATDTLWGLLEYCPEDMGRWEYIGIIMELNGMTDSVVQPGRLYQVPVYKEGERNEKIFNKRKI